MVIVKELSLKSTIAQEIKIFIIEPSIPIEDCGQHFGFDPGTVNIGLAELGRGKYINAFQIKLVRDADPVNRILNFYTLMSECFSNFVYPSFAVIENAAFGQGYRQAELAELRASAVFWFHYHGIDQTKFISPQSIRKTVFGSGKIKAHTVWTELPADCAAAISCAYASMFRVQEEMRKNE